MNDNQRGIAWTMLWQRSMKKQLPWMKHAAFVACEFMKSKIYSRLLDTDCFRDLEKIILYEHI